MVFLTSKGIFCSKKHYNGFKNQLLVNYVWCKSYLIMSTIHQSWRSQFRVCVCVMMPAGFHLSIPEGMCQVLQIRVHKNFTATSQKLTIFLQISKTVWLWWRMFQQIVTQCDLMAFSSCSLISFANLLNHFAVVLQLEASYCQGFRRKCSYYDLQQQRDYLVCLSLDMKARIY